MSRSAVFMFAGAMTVLACSDSPTAPPTRVADVRIVSDVDTLAIADTLHLTVVATDIDGNELHGLRARWSSSDAQVAAVDSDGRVVGRASGAVMIAVDIEGRRAYTEIVVIPPASRITDIAGAWTHSCVLAADARIYCGGWNQYGMLGNGTGLNGQGGSLGSPTIGATAGGIRFASLSAYGVHTCALARTGEAYCWGMGLFGRLGTTTHEFCQADPRVTAVVVECHVKPTRIAGTDQYRAIAAGIESTCALRMDGRAFCWGENSRGALGSSQYGMYGLPLAVDGDFVFQTLAAGRNHVCATTPDFRAYCWGSNYRGQLGSDAVPTCVFQYDGCYARQPYAVLGGHSFVRLDGGGFHTCGITTTQALYCWGDNTFGQLGDGTLVGRLLPRRVGTESFTSVSLGDFHTCAVTVGGDAFCWGLNDDGQLGAPSDETCLDGGDSYPCAATPLEVGGGYRFAKLELGMYHSCGVTVEGQARCWGWNQYGQLANGGYVGGTTSTPVLLGATAGYQRVLTDAPPSLRVFPDSSRYQLPRGRSLRFSTERD